MKLHAFVDSVTVCGLVPDGKGWPPDEACVHPGGWVDIPKRMRCETCDVEMSKPPESGTPIWVLYNSPSDYPGKIVGRRQIAMAGRVLADVEPFAIGDTVAEVRAALPPGLVHFPRALTDNPIIIETWL